MTDIVNLGSGKALVYRELGADALAEHAFNLFLYQGRHALGAKLIYEALRQDPYHVLALRCLADLLEQKGTEIFSAIVLEYARMYATIVEESELDALEEILFISKWSWGFARHASGKTELSMADFADRSQFITDHERYQTFLDEIFTRTESLETGFQAAHRVCGLMAQFVEHKEGIDAASQFEAIFNPQNFVMSDAHEAWLDSYDPVLDELMLKRVADDVSQLKS